MTDDIFLAEILGHKTALKLRSNAAETLQKPWLASSIFTNNSWKFWQIPIGNQTDLFKARPAGYTKVTTVLGLIEPLGLGSGLARLAALLF